jgi:naphthalene 1,2-dioxygenase system ferredoxin subunit
MRIFGFSRRPYFLYPMVMTSDTVWRRVSAVQDLPEDDMRAVDVDGHALALYNVEGRIYATDRICTHGQACLTDGFLNGAVVECPLHGGGFDVRTGAGQGAPILRDLRTYEVEISNGDILIALEAPAS